MKTGVIVAMDKELEQLRSLFEGSEVVVRKAGIGKVNAALGAAEMIRQHRPDVIISTGCAGGYGEGVEVQDVVVSEELCYHDVYCGKAVDGSTRYGQVQGMPARFSADERLLEVARRLDCGVKVHQGLVATGDWFVDSREKMAAIVEAFPDVLAVDMESAAIAQACYVYKVPFISFRVVSDLPMRDTDASMYHDFWLRIADRSFQVTRTFIESLSNPRNR